jgi:hypothetical protein
MFGKRSRFLAASGITLRSPLAKSDPDQHRAANSANKNIRCVLQFHYAHESSIDISQNRRAEVAPDARKRTRLTHLEILNLQ